MMQKALRHLSILLLPVILLLSSCAFADNETDNGDALTLCAGNVYIRFQKLWDLLAETYPEIELDFISYTGSNATGYSWTQMQADDISDIFMPQGWCSGFPAYIRHIFSAKVRTRTSWKG